MIKVLICDDEGIVRQSLRFIIEKAFGEKCKVEEAKRGRDAIELCRTFRPDVAFMDIQMPGINGIDAMKEMRKENPNIIFIVLTAYDRFGYAKDAIELGVLEYLTKPIGKDKVVEVLRRAIKEVEERRFKSNHDLEVREKLETVVPMIEQGFIYGIIMQEEGVSDDSGYVTLLGIEGKKGFIEVVEFGEDHREGKMTNPVGSNVKMQKFYEEFREIVKEYTDCIMGAPMSNKIVFCVTTEEEQVEYDERVKVIDNTRAMVRKLEQRIDMKFKVGIGSLKPMELLNESYHEALEALRQNLGKVTHVKDIPVGCDYEEVYPLEIEEMLFDALNKGNANVAREVGESFVEWLQKHSPEMDNNARLKLLEFVLRAEEIAYRHGGITYRLSNRQGYMEAVLGCVDYEELASWFLDKITEACHNIKSKQKEQNISLVEQAKAYIEKNFSSELSLDEISREVNVSPYYFSKLFKEETGINYIEYLTKIRIEHAKKLLQNPEYSIKLVCVEVGYCDPNYFSRLFKKMVGMTPTEYRGENAYES